MGYPVHVDTLALARVASDRGLPTHAFIRVSLTTTDWCRDVGRLYLHSVGLGGVCRVCDALKDIKTGDLELHCIPSSS